ncbi:MAG: hypothetical protein QOG15_2761, partial [Solirubrobacteraceae bacterium]|nr:hypothetical protein [Solirubrobacteraceae bacterium]
MKWHFSAAVLVAVVGTLLVVPSSQAFTGVPVWNCRASTTYTSVSGNNRVEPVVANGKPNTANGANPDNAQCADADVGAGNLLTPIGVPQASLGLQTASARTNVTPELGQAINQHISSSAKVEGLNLGTFTVQAAVSAATGSCSGTTPTLQGTSQVVGIGSGSLDPLIGALANVLSVAPALISIKINEQIRTADSLTVRAMHVKVLSPTNGPPLLDLVVAESKVGFNGPVCDPDLQNPGGQICPDGSTYDPDRNLCIIVVPGGTDIIVGRPFEGPEG